LNKLKILSLFSGIGAFEKALERLDIDYELVNYCEIDKYASRAYSLIHNTSEDLNLGDITKVDEKTLPDFDLMTWGFPCTSISQAGKQEGFIDKDGKQTKSGLYYEGIRILQEKKPKYSIIENVKALTQKKFKTEFEQILTDLESAGYNTYWKVLNSKDYGVPQNRERIFIISVRKDIDNCNFKFPEGFDNSIRLKDLLEDEVDEKYYISQDKTEKLIKQLKGKEFSNTVRAGGRGSLDRHQWDMVCVNTKMQNTQIRDDGFCCTLTSSMYKEPPQVIKVGNTHPSGNGMNGCVYSEEGLAPTVTTNKGEGSKILQIGMLDIKGNEQIRRVYDPEGLSPTLNTMAGGSRQPKIIVDNTNFIEIWKDIKGFENRYKISNLGRVKSLNRVINTGNNGHRELKETIIIPALDRYGYLKIQLSKDNIPTYTTVHRLVAEMFIENPENKPEVNHIDGNKLNNIPNNLEWATTLENQRHRKEILRKQGSKPNIPKGASWNTEKSTWVSYIKINNKSHFIKYCKSKEEAYEAYFYEFIKEYGYEPWDINAFQDESIDIIKNKPKILESNELKFVGGIDTTDKWIDNEKGFSRNYKEGYRVYDSEGIACCQKTNGGGLGSNTGLYLENIYRIRKLTPLECVRLMGFDDEDYYILKENGISNSQIYKMAGNSIVVNVLEEIFKELFKDKIHNL